MIELQVINKVLNEQNMGFILNNGIGQEHFVAYQNEFMFILNHFNTYAIVPDHTTFLSTFPNFPLQEIRESDAYLIDTLDEQRVFQQLLQLSQEVQEMSKHNSLDAVEHMRSVLPTIQMTKKFNSVDIISGAESRLTEFMDKKTEPTAYSISTGRAEIDKLLHGFNRGEELVVVVARTGQGKTWLMLEFSKNAWRDGNTVGFISPEMTPNKLGYRFDTLNANFSNTGLNRGYEVDGYVDYIKELQKSGVSYHVSTPRDFQKKITVSKLRAYCLDKKLDMLCIDGITYLSDERTLKGDTRNNMITNISEDLMELSIELGIPILVVVQSNRGGVKKDDEEATPDLEDIRDSDGLSFNASKVLSMRQKKGVMRMVVKKNRGGSDHGEVVYHWDIDTGTFIHVPSGEDVGGYQQPKPQEVPTTDFSKAFEAHVKGSQGFTGTNPF